MSALRKPTLALLFHHPGDWIAFGLGTGLSPIAPGTLGTLLAIPLGWWLWRFPIWVFVLTTVGVTVLGIALCGQAARHIGVHDHPGINLDEIAGYLFSIIWVPHTWIWLGAAFLVFRTLDIVKPWPISVLDRRLGGGLGIMADDVAAGIVTGLLLWALSYIPVFR